MGDEFVSPCRNKVIACLVLTALLVLGIASTAMAAPGLQWQTDRVYYDGSGRMIIEGYFYNNGTRVINWVNWHNVKVYFRRYDSDWWLAAGATFYDLNLHLYPGDSVRWTFRIYDVERYHFDYWQVKWNVNYNYK
jgi:hypothetical protein